MKLDHNTRIGGQSVKLVRDLLAEVGRYDDFGTSSVETHLQKNWWRSTIDKMIKAGKLPHDARATLRRDWTFYGRQRTIYGVRFEKMPNFTAPARELIEALLNEGFIERHERANTAYHCTMKGQALRMTTFVPRMNRDKAAALLNSALERVQRINADDELLHWVTEVRVFGSYLTDSDDLGDLDLAIKLERRLVGKEYVEACLTMARESGKTFSTYVDELNYPERCLRQLVKNRSPYISLHWTDELDKNPQFGGKTVYRFEPPKHLHWV